MELTEEDSFEPELDSRYSELVDSVQEYDEALNQYEEAITTYETVLSNFKEGMASPVEMKEAMDHVVYADNQLIETVHDRIEGAVTGVEEEFSVKGDEDNVVSMATEHTLAVQKIEETTDNVSDIGSDFIKTLNDIENLFDRSDTTLDIMDRDEEFLSERLDYSWKEATEKARDYDEEVQRAVEGWELDEKRTEVIKEDPNDRYIGGITSDTGTNDLERKREEVLGVDEEDLEEARNRVQGRNPRYIQ